MTNTTPTLDLILTAYTDFSNRTADRSNDDLLHPNDFGGSITYIDDCTIRTDITGDDTEVRVLTLTTYTDDIGDETMLTHFIRIDDDPYMPMI